MSKCNGDPEKCGICRRHGLPILLTRYAVATKAVEKVQPDGLLESFAPALGSGFGVDIESPLGPTAQYTLRRLRNGYVYLYDERRNKWQAYYVNTSGFLSEFQFPKADWSKSAASSEDDKIPCDPANLAKGLCVTIMSPATEAGIVWIAFSDVEWSENVYLEHQKESVRALHMRKFDVAAWLASREHGHAAPIVELGERVAEFKSDVNVKSFKQFSSAAFDSMMASEIVRAFDSMAKGEGAIVALDDPVGIARDLSTLMAVRHEGFKRQERFVKRYHASTTIKAFLNGLSDSVDAEVIRVREKKAREFAMERLGPGVMSRIERNHEEVQDHLRNYDLRSGGMTNSREKYLDILEVRWEDLRSARHEATTKYTGGSRFNLPQMNAFDLEFKTTSETHYIETIEPLSRVHAAWMKSSCMTEYFKNNFSPLDSKYSGLVYRALVISCIGGTQMWRYCREVIEGWFFEGPFGDHENLLIRAVICNSDAIIPSLNNLAIEYQELLDDLKSDIEKRQEDSLGVKLPLVPEGLLVAIEAVFAQTGKLFPVSYSLLGMSSQYSAAMVNVLSNSGPQGVSGRVLALLNLEAGGGVIVPTEIYGSKMATAWFGMESALGIASEKGVRMGRPNEARKLFMNRAQIALRNVESKPAPRTRAYYVLTTEQVRKLALWQAGGMVDLIQQKALVGELSSMFRVERISHYMRLRAQGGYVLTATLPADIEKAIAAIGAHDNAMAAAYKTRTGVFAAGGAGWSSLVFGLSIVGLKGSWEALVRPGQSDAQQLESLTRFGAIVSATVAAAASIVEAAEIASRNLAMFQFMQRYKWMSHELVRKFARFPAAGAALVLSLWDLKDAYVAAQEDRVMLATAYGVAGFAGLASIYYIFVSFSFIGILVGALAVATSFLISELKPDMYEDWLERCEFGYGVEGRGSGKYATALDAQIGWENALEKAGVPDRSIRKAESEAAYAEAMKSLSLGVR